jgi:hypothetical protein
MGRLLKPGGLFAAKTQWLWRYHANPTYGDYFRYSARALEFLCTDAGLNPVLSGYQQMVPEVDGKPVSKKLERGSPWKHNATDVPPVRIPLETLFPSFVVCYKPRAGEKEMSFGEVGTKHVRDHPRFDLDFAKAAQADTKELRGRRPVTAMASGLNFNFAAVVVIIFAGGFTFGFRSGLRKRRTARAG